MASDIAAAVAGLTGTNAAATLAATKAAAQSDAAGTTPFSAFISDPAQGLSESRRSLLGSDTERVDYGLFANRNSAVVSTGETTGSWARDLLRGLASIAALTPDKIATGPGYTDFITGVQQGLKSSVTALSLERGSLGLVEKRLSTLRDQHETITTSLTAQVADIEEVDMAKTITAMQATQSQLEASYRAMSLAQQLTLTRFLS
jgi:flagellin-like hook-associated protein FlgL